MQCKSGFIISTSCSNSDNSNTSSSSSNSGSNSSNSRTEFVTDYVIQIEVSPGISCQKHQTRKLVGNNCYV